MNYETTKILFLIFQTQMYYYFWMRKEGGREGGREERRKEGREGKRKRQSFSLQYYRR